jgi:hypothetical protein
MSAYDDIISGLRDLARPYIGEYADFMDAAGNVSLPGHREIRVPLRWSKSRSYEWVESEGYLVPIPKTDYLIKAESIEEAILHAKKEGKGAKAPE